MTYFVEADQFKQMISYNPYVTEKKDKKNVKYSLLEQIKSGIGDKWDRLKEGTRQAFDMICFFSAELGFFYASDEYLAERHEISDRTIRNRLKELEELGQVVKVHRRAKRCNGRGKPIYLFVNHPYFTYWVNMLNITHDFHSNFQTGNDEIPCESKEEGAKNVPTYSLPLKQESNNYKSDIMVLKKYADYKIQDIAKKGITVKYISSYINKLFKSLEIQSLHAENNRIEAKKKELQQRASENYKKSLGIRKPVPFYNWLEE